eukprot:1128380-Amphidinium_carterae.1
MRAFWTSVGPRRRDRPENCLRVRLPSVIREPVLRLDLTAVSCCTLVLFNVSIVNGILALLEISLTYTTLVGRSASPQKRSKAARAAGFLDAPPRSGS